MEELERRRRAEKGKKGGKKSTPFLVTSSEISSLPNYPPQFFSPQKSNCNNACQGPLFVRCYIFFLRERKRDARRRKSFPRGERFRRRLSLSLERKTDEIPLDFFDRPLSRGERLRLLRLSLSARAMPRGLETASRLEMSEFRGSTAVVRSLSFS